MSGWDKLYKVFYDDRWITCEYLRDYSPKDSDVWYKVFSPILDSNESNSDIKLDNALPKELLVRETDESLYNLAMAVSA